VSLSILAIPRDAIPTVPVAYSVYDLFPNNHNRPPALLVRGITGHPFGQQILRNSYTAWGLRPLAY
jgi:hypothetical protein